MSEPERPGRASSSCDACRQRKVKCNRASRCSQCTHLGLKCTYLKSNPSLRTRRATTRGVVIQAYRESTIEPKSSDRFSALRAASAGTSPPHFTCEHLNTATFFRSLEADYAQALPHLPIVPVSEFRSAIDTMPADSAATALLYVLAATTLNMTVPQESDRPARNAHVKALCYAALERRGIVMPNHVISISTIMVSTLVATYLFTQDPTATMGWFFFNEAVTCTALLWARQREPDGQLKRLYWIIWIHERFNAMAWRRRPMLQTIEPLPREHPDLPPNVESGLGYMVDLWRIMDDVFLQNWLDDHSPALTPAWIEGKQSQLAYGVEQWENDIKSLNHKQQLDLIVTRHWMRTLLWQMALSKFLLKSDESQSGSMGFGFPAHISRRLRVVLTNTPHGVIEAYGTGVIHKSFDIVSTLADLLEHVLHTMCDAQTIADYVDDFSFMYHFLTDDMTDFRDSDRVFLKKRYKTLRALYPQLWR